MLVFLVAVIGLVLIGVAAKPSFLADLPQASIVPLAEMNVGALGRIEPHTDVLHINAPSIMEPPVVETLKVAVGDTVDKGQVLAVLDSNRRKQAELDLAKADLVLAEKSLAKVLAGAKEGEIHAQESLLEQVQQRLSLAETRLDRAQRLLKLQATSQDQQDESASNVKVLKRELRQQEAALEALREVRTVDV